MDAETLLISQIEELEQKLASLRMMLQQVQTTKQKLGDAQMRFFNWRPVDAARVVLEKHGKKIKRDQLIKILVDGGIAVGKKRPMVNIRRSFETNVALGNLIESGEYLDIPR